MKYSLILFMIGVAHWAFAEPSRSPMEWRPVHTNEIAQWKSVHKVSRGLVVDRARRSVRLLVEATGVDADEPIEFLAIGPLSDRAYESLFVSVATPAELTSAFDSIGMPRGKGTDVRLAQFWPQGEKVKLAVAPVGKSDAGLDSVLKDMRVSTEGLLLDKPVVYTAGTRDQAGMPLAETNMPCAIFALYNHGPSLFQFDGVFDQSAAYGRFAAVRKLTKGALYELTATWDGVPRVKEFELQLSVSNAVDQVAMLRKLAEQKQDVFAKLAFAPSVTVEQAANMAQAFAALDGAGVKMNGAVAGQFYFRAFLPRVVWLAREKRDFQPFEVRLATDGTKTFTFVEEDYSGDGIDPVLKPKTTPFKEWSELLGLIAKSGAEADKISVLFLYAPKTARVADLTPILAATMPRISTFYIFGE